MGQVTIGANVYNIGRLDVFRQLDIARLYSPVLAQIGLLTRSPTPEGEKPIDRKAVLNAMMIFARPISMADNDFVTGACLNVIQRRQANGTGWAKIRDEASGRLMFQDLTLPEILELIYVVLEEHRLTDFFYAPPSSTGDQADPSSTGSATAPTS